MHPVEMQRLNRSYPENALMIYSFVLSSDEDLCVCQSYLATNTLCKQAALEALLVHETEAIQ